MTIITNFLSAALEANDDVAESLAAQLTPADEPALLTALDDTNSDVRWWAVRALALIGERASVAPLLHKLDDSDPMLRSAALLALAALYGRQPAAVQPHLTQLARLLADPEGTVRQAATDALSQCGDAAVPALATVLQGDHQGARTRATLALRQIATMPAAAVLYHCLNDSNYMVHTYAYETLDEMGLLENVLLVV
ncbi:MAG: HEAT repeat domain-containing protein [Caldilineaceae bacterium]